MLGSFKRFLRRYADRNKWLRPLYICARTVYRRPFLWAKQAYYSLWRYLRPVEENTVLFAAFGGESYCCSPKAIYEAMLRDPRFREFRFIWLFQKDTRQDHGFLLSNPNTAIVSGGTGEERGAYAKAKYWISNSGVPAEIRSKRKQVYIETWHGVPLKRIGCDILYESDPYRTREEICRDYRRRGKIFTRILSTSQWYSEQISSAFDLKRAGNENAVAETGYPRNDALFHAADRDIERIRTRLGISEEKKVILYAPTFRDTDRDEAAGYMIVPPLDIQRLFQRIGEDYCLLLRAHHVAAQFDLVPEGFGDRVLDVAGVEDINDLYLISDILVTDYSSACFDYAHLRRPEIFFMYDLDAYAGRVRGFYFDIGELPGPVVKTTEELADAILEASNEFHADEKYERFLEKFVTFDDGNATERVLDLILQEGD